MPKRNAFADRLALIAKGRSQAEIARRTGTSGPNVSRYLAGTRVPAEFCTALVEQFGVNPTWLLTGKGAPYSADIAASGEQLAGSLLELVEAMEAVARMRLGAVTGQAHSLRELHDATQRYEQLRARLNKHSRPVLERLLSQLSDKMAKRHVDEAEELLRTADGVAAFCEDEVMRTGVNSFRAEISFMRGRQEQAMQQQHDVVMHMLLSDQVREEGTYLQVFNLASVLNTRRRFRESRRLTAAALALGEDNQRWRAIPLLRAMLGLIDLELGDLHGALTQIHAGLSRLSDVEPAVTADTIAYQRSHLTRIQLLSGALSLPELLAQGNPMPWNFYAATEHALWLEQREHLNTLCKDIPERGRGADPVTSLVYIAARRMNEALAGKRKALAAFEPLSQEVLARDNAPFVQFTAHALHAQLAFVCGNRGTAIEQANAAAALRQELEPALTLPLEIRAIHSRTLNRLGLPGGSAFFERHLAAGYHAFRALN